jgi:hypothetical protein
MSGAEDLAPEKPQVDRVHGMFPAAQGFLSIAR